MLDWLSLAYVAISMQLYGCLNLESVDSLAVKVVIILYPIIHQVRAGAALDFVVLMKN